MIGVALTGGLAVGIAWAEGTPPACAEASAKLSDATSRGSYPAVEGAYAALRAGRCPMGVEAHLAGGRASAMLGEPHEALERFSLAGPSGAPEVVAIESAFGRSRLGPRVGREALEPATHGPRVVDTGAPEKRATVERARLVLEQGAVYEGLLPVGQYKLGRTTIVVRPLRGGP